MKILVVDDHPLVRKGIISTLSFEKYIDSILESSNKNEAMNIIQMEKPELAIVDLYLGREDVCLERLTSREKEVLVELGNGLSNYEIARKLYISENTVKKHVSNILSKLELEHRTQAALLVNKSANF